MGNTTAIVFDIQKFSVHDGPGIRTLIFTKGCRLRCQWCANPESQLAEVELMFYPEKCIKCDRCVDSCEPGAVSIEQGRPVYERRLCTLCGKCAGICYAEAIKMVGRRVTPAEIMEEIKKDSLFYRNSGGGVTFSGGEPALWPDFLVAVAQACERENINVAVETSGYTPRANMEKIARIDNLETIMFDLKHIDEEKHKLYCGASNTMIMDNLQYLSGTAGCELVVRVPVIPGVNDSGEVIEAIAKFASKLKNISRIELLPYHKFGVNKYQRLLRDYSLSHLEPPGQEKMERLKSKAGRYLHTKIIG